MSNELQTSQANFDVYDVSIMSNESLGYYLFDMIVLSLKRARKRFHNYLDIPYEDIKIIDLKLFYIRSHTVKRIIIMNN